MAAAPVPVATEDDGEEREEQPFLILCDTTDQQIMSKREKCMFKLIPPEVEGSSSELATLIYENGGDVLRKGMDSPDSDYAITLLDEIFYLNNPERNRTLPLDTYSSMYIYDFIGAKQEKSAPPDLNKYKLTDSQFDSYDANKIVSKKLKWSDLKPKRQKEARRIKAQDLALELKKELDKVKQKQARGERNKQPSEQQVRNVTEPGPETGKSAVNTDRNQRESEAGPSKKTSKTMSSDINQRSILNPDEGTDDVQLLPPKRQKLANLNSESASNNIREDGGNETAGYSKAIDNVRIATTPQSPTFRSGTLRQSQNPKSDDDSIKNCPSITTMQRSKSALGTGDGNKDCDTDTTKTPLAPACNPDKSKSDQPRITIVPHPNTSATIRRPVINLVTRAVAGPSGNRGMSTVQNRNLSKGKSPEPEVGPSGDCSIIVDEDEDNSRISDDIDSLSEDDFESVASKDSHRKRYGQRAPFLISEGQKILDLICENDAYLYTKGIKLWKQMESAEIFPGRTHQSLKEHFRKKVLPNALNAKVYKISPVHLKRLQKAQKRANWTRHSNFCPEYKF